MKDHGFGMYGMSREMFGLQVDCIVTLSVVVDFLQLFLSEIFSGLFQDLTVGLILSNSLDLKLEHILFPCSSVP